MSSGTASYIEQIDALKETVRRHEADIEFQYGLRGPGSHYLATYN